MNEPFSSLTSSKYLLTCDRHVAWNGSPKDIFVPGACQLKKCLRGNMTSPKKAKLLLLPLALKMTKHVQLGACYVQDTLFRPHLIFTVYLQIGYFPSYR